MAHTIIVPIDIMNSVKWSIHLTLFTLPQQPQQIATVVIIQTDNRNKVDPKDRKNLNY